MMTRYVSGMQALNLCSRDETPGDWHSAQDWSHLHMLDTSVSPFSEWGILHASVPGHGIMPVADHARACLDLIDHHYLNLVEGMRDSYIDNENFTRPIFDQVWKLHGRKDWDLINRFMGFEYKMDWLKYLTEKKAGWPSGSRPAFVDYQKSIKPF